MRGLRELVFSVTNRCTARCQDCPVVHNGEPPATLTPAVMKPIVDDVYGWGSLGLVVFTGGEPFLLGDDLREMVAYVARLGVYTRIVTNAYWAKSKEAALATLSEMKAAGLTEINFSCDEYHQEFIPMEYIRNANDAAAEIGLPALLAFRRKPGGSLTPETLSSALGVKLELFDRKSKNPDNHVVHVGRNLPILSDSQRPYTEADEIEVGFHGACRSVLGNIVIAPDLHVRICCGIARHTIPELTIGSLKEERLAVILERGNQDLIANWLALEGPSSILDFVRAKDPEISLPADGYVGICHACNQIFSNARAREILRRYGAEHQTALLMMRGALDWVCDRWMPGSEPMEFDESVATQISGVAVKNLPAAS